MYLVVHLMFFFVSVCIEMMTPLGSKEDIGGEGNLHELTSNLQGAKSSSAISDSSLSSSSLQSADEENTQDEKTEESDSSEEENIDDDEVSPGEIT